jgi:very-short-patch-repair endonuclease
LEYWRLHHDAVVSDASRRKTALPVTVPDSKLLYSAGVDGLSLPLDILLANCDARRRKPSLRQHLHRNVTPAGSLVRINDALLVSSPEFCFLQMANELSLVELLELGYELCGSYALPATADSIALATLCIDADQPPLFDHGFKQRPPMTSKKKLRDFLAQTPGTKGHKLAKHALRYIVDNAASPMEAKLSILLVLPYRLGGYGFAPPELNARIVPAKSARRSASKSSYRCDLFWPDYDVAVEYDSDQFHTGPSRIASDSKRRNTLSSIGIVTITVTNQQIHSIVEFEKVARQLASSINRRLQFKNPDFFKAQQQLRRQLL